MFLTILACFLEASRRPGIFNSFRSYSYETEHVSYDLGLLLGGVAQARDSGWRLQLLLGFSFC